MKRIGVVVTLALAFSVLTTSLVQADPLTSKQARYYMHNSMTAAPIPIWKITQAGTADSVTWTDWPSNPRFAVYDPLNDSDLTNDLVLDKATGLVWTRDTSLGGTTMTWGDGQRYCRRLYLGNVMGFRMPSIEEMYTLMTAVGMSGLGLNVPPSRGWWTSTPAAGPPPRAGHQ